MPVSADFENVRRANQREGVRRTTPAGFAWLTPHRQAKWSRRPLIVGLFPGTIGNTSLWPDSME